MFNIEPLIKLNERLIDALDEVRWKLKEPPQPEEMIIQFVTALDSVTRILTLINNELLVFLSNTAIEEDNNIDDLREYLLANESGSFHIKTTVIKGICLKISAIYDKHLEKWFFQNLTDIEARKLKQIFDELGDANLHVSSNANSIGIWLESESVKLLDWLDEDDYQLVKQSYTLSRVSTRNIRKTLNILISKIRSIQVDFVFSHNIQIT